MLKVKKVSLSTLACSILMAIATQASATNVTPSATSGSDIGCSIVGSLTGVSGSCSNISSGSVSGTVSGTNAGIKINDVSGSGQNLTLTSGSNVSGAGETLWQAWDYSETIYGQVSGRIGSTGLLINDSTLDKVTIESGARLYGVVGMYVGTDAEGWMHTARKTNIGTIEVKGTIETSTKVTTRDAHRYNNGGIIFYGHGGVHKITVDNLNIASGGQVIAHNGAGIALANGLYLSGALTNSGLISGTTYGIHLYYAAWSTHFSAPQVESIVSSGTISGADTGIYIGQDIGNNLGEGKYQIGLKKLEIKNGGTVTGGVDGIAAAPGYYQMGHFEVESGATVSGGRNGVWLNSKNASISDGVIVSGTVSGGSGIGLGIVANIGSNKITNGTTSNAAFQLTESAHITGATTGVHLGGTTNGILIKGAQISGGTVAVNIEGTVNKITTPGSNHSGCTSNTAICIINSSSGSGASLTTQEGGTSLKIGPSILTQINGDIYWQRSGNVSISNLGSLNGKLTVSGSGDLTIQDWAVVVKPGNGQLNTVTPTEVEVTNGENGASVGSVKVEHVTIANRENGAKPNLSIDLSEAITVNGEGVAPESADLSETLKGLGFSGWYGGKDDPIFHSSYSVSSSAGAIVSQTMANQLFRRDFFLDASLTQTATDSLRHRRVDGVMGTAFVKPYTARESFLIDKAHMSGQTNGVLLGANHFVGKHMLSTYAGYERSQFDAYYNTTTLGLDAQSWFAGFTTAHLMYSTPTLDAFIKGGLKVSYSALNLKRGFDTLGQSEADTGTVAAGANTALGINWRFINRGQLIPMVGIGYSVGKTNSYQLDRTGMINDSYMPNRVHLPYLDANITWYQGYSDVFRTFMSAGVRQVLRREQRSTVQFDKDKISGTYELPGTYSYLNTSLVMQMSKQSELAIGYTGVFDETGQSNNLTLKYELHY